MVRKTIECGICGECLDIGACNQEYAIITLVKDSDATGTKQERMYLCDLHSAGFEVWLHEQRLKDALK